MTEPTLCGRRTSRGFNTTTTSGKPFWPLAPRAEDIRLSDIAEHLSRICRYGGALRSDVEFYSVAQHSWYCSYIVENGYELEALLHDAAEAYVGDMVRPLKLDMPEYRAVEDVIDRAIRLKFGLPVAMSPAVKLADRIACATEKRDLIAKPDGVEWGDMPEPHRIRIDGVSPFVARQLFLDRCRELGISE